jgi:hypothetical protein
MGAHSATGHRSARTATAAAGLAAALVTTAATGLLTGGTALATDGSGHGGSGHGGHSRGHGARSSDGWDTGWDTDDAGSGLAAQTWCDVMGDIGSGGDDACASGDPSDASGSDASGAAVSGATVSNAAAPAAAAPASAAPAPRPRPTSSVPDHPTIQPIVAPSGGRKVVPIAAAH